MAALVVWTLADAFALSFISMAMFRALQGIGASMTVPSTAGIIPNYFVSSDRTLALTIFGASGAVGFCLRHVFGGFLISSLGLALASAVVQAVDIANGRSALLQYNKGLWCCVDLAGV